VGWWGADSPPSVCSMLWLTVATFPQKQHLILARLCQEHIPPPADIFLEFLTKYSAHGGILGKHG